MKTNLLQAGLDERMIAAQARAVKPAPEKISNVISLRQTSFPTLRVGWECRREDFLERMMFVTLFASVVLLIAIALALS